MPGEKGLDAGRGVLRVFQNDIGFIRLNVSRVDGRRKSTGKLSEYTVSRHPIKHRNGSGGDLEGRLLGRARGDAAQLRNAVRQPTGGFKKAFDFVAAGIGQRVPAHCHGAFAVFREIHVKVGVGQRKQPCAFRQVQPDR